MVEKSECRQLLFKPLFERHTKLYYSRVLNLMGIMSPYPCKNIIAVNYILADTQAHQSKRHRQQNNEI